MSFLKYKWNRPSEDIHEVWQQIGVMRVVKLLDIKTTILHLDHCSLVIVHIAVVRSRKHSHHHRKLLWPIPGVKLVPLLLNFMSTDHADIAVILQKLLSCSFTEVERTIAFSILQKIHLGIRKFSHVVSNGI